jgi:hypothetical protein
MLKKQARNYNAPAVFFSSFFDLDYKNINPDVVCALDLDKLHEQHRDV